MAQCEHGAAILDGAPVPECERGRTFISDEEFRRTYVPPSPLVTGKEPDPTDPPVFLLQAAPTWAPWLNDGMYQRVQFGALGSAITAQSDGSVAWTATVSGVSVTAYGADPTGTADSTAAIQAALNAASNSAVYFPAGIYKVSSPLTVKAGTTLVGSGNGASVIRLAASANITQIIGMTANQRNFSLVIRDLQIDGNSGNGAVCQNGIYLFSPNDCILDNLRLVNMANFGITLDGSAGLLGTATKVNKVFIRTCGQDGIHITAFSTDTQLVSCDFGTCTNFAYYLGGHNTFMAACAGWGSGNGLFVDTTGGHLYCAASRFDFNQFEGVILNGNVVMMGDCLVYNNGQVSNATHAGIQVGAVAFDIGLSNIRSYGAFQVTNNQSYGLQLTAGHSNVRVTGGNYAGNGTGSITGVNSSDRIAHANGYNPQAATTPGMATSGSPFTNPNGYDCMVLLTGGTVSQVAIGGTNTGQTSGWFRVPATQTITVTWSVSPSWTWFGD